MRFLICIFGILTVIFLSSCTYDSESPQKMRNVGMLIDSTLDDNEWNQVGYKGLQKIGELYNADVFVQENTETKYEMINAVEELKTKGVNLIFGHSNRYGKTFVDVAKMYPDIHFVYLNGGHTRENVTSLNLSSQVAMGFFSGMVASKMTETGHVGIIAAYEWQPEIEGFYEGAKFEDPLTNVHINYTNGRDEEEVASYIYDEMKAKDMDVVYPAWHSFSKNIIEQTIEDDLYSIGYFLQEEDYNEPKLLTSTIQQIDLFYEQTAERFNEQLLEGGIYFYGLSESAITFGPFSSLVPSEFQEIIQKYIHQYKETNLLPNEQ